MKIAVLGGGGAMGGLFGGYLARAGHDVTLLDVSKQAVDAVNRNGLSIDEKDGSTAKITVAATEEPSKAGTADLIINFVKCYHTDAAIRSVLPIIGDETMVLSLQNGWGNADRIAAVIDRSKLIVGLTYHSATLLAPGHVKHPGAGVTHIGELDGRMTPRLERVVDALKGAGFETQASSSVLNEVWKKLALNVCTLPTAGLLRFFANQLGEHEGTRSLMRGLLQETVAVAEAQQIALDFDERWSAITGLLERAVGAKASMLQDVEAQRRTEIDVINGAIIAAGRKHGIATPFNDAMVWLIKSLEEAYLADPAKAAA